MLKKTKKILVSLIICAFVMSGILTGCSSGIMGINSEAKEESMSPQSVSLVVSGHKYFPELSLSDKLYSRIYNSCYTYGDVSAVVVDGDPFLAFNYTINAPDANVDSAKKKQIATGNTDQIMSNLSNLAGKTPEADLLSAIQLSADMLCSTESTTEKTMVIYDSGLSTTGMLDFAAQNLIETPAESIVAQLKEIHEIPDLTDVHVLWLGCGEVCGEQQKLSEDYKNKLETIWKEILIEGGASDIEFKPSEASGEEPDTELPDCSTVPVIETPIVITGKSMPEITRWDGESSVRFKGDLAEFVDVAAAKEDLRPAAEYLAANPTESVYIFGMTATIIGGGSGIELAEARANACKDVLKEYGVNDKQMTVVGLGQINNPLRVDDVDENGIQIEELAQKNRAVVMIKAQDPMVGTLLKCISDYR